MNWNDLKDDIGKVAPIVGTLIGGPAGAAVGSLVSSALGTENTPDAVATALQNPDSLLKLKQLEISHSEYLANLDSQERLGQIQINDTEAKSTSVFVASWRPLIGYICGAALALSFIIQPLILLIVTIIGIHLDLTQIPKLDWGVLGQILFGMLGLAGMRTYEKVKGLNPGA